MININYSWCHNKLINQIIFDANAHRTVTRCRELTSSPTPLQAGPPNGCRSTPASTAINEPAFPAGKVSGLCLAGQQNIPARYNHCLHSDNPPDAVATPSGNRSPPPDTRPDKRCPHACTCARGDTTAMDRRTTLFRRVGNDPDRFRAYGKRRARHH